jgi:hypothetical protein
VRLPPDSYRDAPHPDSTAEAFAKAVKCPAKIINISDNATTKQGDGAKATPLKYCSIYDQTSVYLHVLKS